MNSFKKLNNIVGWFVFGVAALVYYFAAERTGSLWDCGEFVAGCYKQQVVHPPGAPLFLMIGKIATLIGQMFSSDPSVIAFSVNVLSGVVSALAAMFICWTTIILGKIALVGRTDEPTQPQYIALAGAGIVAGLTTAFATSVWFSAVEGEVYAMSTMFTALTLWCMMKWYNLPDEPEADRWMLLSVYAAGLSTGVHLLSLLTFPALALFYYFKKREKPTLSGMVIAGIAGVVAITVIQKLIITGIPNLWGSLEIMCVNWFGLPFAIPSLILTVGIISAAGYFGLRLAHQRSNSTIQNIVMGLVLSAISFASTGMVLIRANANPPINMNNPSDPLRLIPYLNREQYGERPLLYGPQFNARPIDQNEKDRYGRVKDPVTGKESYEVVDHKYDLVFNDADKVLLPRMGHYEGDRLTWYKRWLDVPENQEISSDRPTSGDNVSFLFRYQMGWMYWRYFMWNFAGRQNGEQGFGPWDKSRGNWVSGIAPLDNARLFNYKNAPERIKHDLGYNKYYLLPLLFGLFGLVWHYGKRRYDMLGLMSLFIITGIGIIIYTNQPPNEPRERDYVIVGSIFTFAIWIGMGVLAFFDLLRDFKLPEGIAAPVATGLVALAPIIMGVQNFDDHSRAKHSGARDYANNFLESCDKNAIIFTYGDNDTYPLWYAQEVEGLRRDVRVVNLSLIAVDWYIDNLRRKINESPLIKMTLPKESYRGDKRNQLPIQEGGEMGLSDVVKFMGEDHPNGRGFESYAPSRKVFVNIDRAKHIQMGAVSEQDSVVEKLQFTLPGSSIIKDDLAVLDIIANNINDRPIYFAVTCRPEKMQGLDDFMQLEGLAVRIVPVKSPSERAFGLIGSGRVATDKVFDRVTKKFLWGNFDKEKTYINTSYQPSVQTTEFTILRTALEMTRQKDTVRAAQLLDKKFEAFPNFNFPYSAETMYFLDAYVRAGAYEKAKKHIKILSDNLLENLNFYNSIDVEVKNTTFQRDFMMDLQTKEQLIALVKQAGDTALADELEKKFAAFKIEQMLPGQR